MLDRTELVDRPQHGVRNGRGVRHIHRATDRGRAKLLSELLSDVLDIRGDVPDRHASILRREGSTDRQANTARAAGDHDRLPLKVQVHVENLRA